VANRIKTDVHCIEGPHTDLGSSFSKLSDLISNASAFLFIYFLFFVVTVWGVFCL
jgi:hypothetical protein